MGSRGGFLDMLEGAALVGTFVPNPWVKYISMGIGMYISSLGKGSDQPPVTSETYGWNQAPNKTAANGTPMPVIYGKMRVKPVLKNRYITMEGKKQFLHALYSFACHGIDERVVEEWAAGRVYGPGHEVTNALEPGKTYVCRYGHMSVRLFDGDGALMPQWVEGVGTAKITDIQVNGEDITALNQYGLEYWTRPGQAVQAGPPPLSTR